MSSVVLSEVISRRIADWGIRHVFGVPGEDLVELLDALRRQGVLFVASKQENSGAFMAEAYGLATGRPGVVLTTRGPGACNVITGVAHAYLDRSPLIVITGSCREGSEIDYPRQNVDLRALFGPVTKLSARLKPSDADVVFENAFSIAISEPPGPVHLMLAPEDAGAGVAYLSHRGVRGGLREQAAEVVFGDVDTIASLIEQAERPSILAGPGVIRARASGLLTMLARRLKAPVATTLKAKGVIPESDSLALGPVGLGCGNDRAVAAVYEASDLVLLVGYEPAEAVESWERFLRQLYRVVGISSTRLCGKYCGLTAEVVGDLGAILRILVERVSPRKDPWLSTSARPLQTDGALFDESRPLGLAVAGVFGTLRRVTPRDAVLCVDTGSHKVAAGAFWLCDDPWRFLASNALATMGYALPAAIGTSLALPGKAVLCVMGDGGFYMSGFEIETAVRLGVSVIVVVLCDGMYHRVWVKQRHLGLPSVAVEFNKPRVAEIARAQGASGYYVRDLEDLAGVCEYAFDRRGVTVVEVPVDPGSYDEVYNRGFKLVDLISRGRRALGGGVQKG